jgi:hypothetical protein
MEPLLQKQGARLEDTDVPKEPQVKMPKTGKELPPAAHPPVRPDQPAPLDDMPVPPLTDSNETKGG